MHTAIFFCIEIKIKSESKQITKTNFRRSQKKKKNSKKIDKVKLHENEQCEIELGTK